MIAGVVGDEPSVGRHEPVQANHAFPEGGGAREIIDMYDSPRDTGPQLRKFLNVLAAHRLALEEQMADLVANLDEVREHEREAKALLARADKRSAVG